MNHTMKPAMKKPPAASPLLVGLLGADLLADPP